MTGIQIVFIIYDFLRPVLDVALLAYLIYKAYELLVKTQALQLVKGAGFLALVYGVAYVLNLSTLQWVLNILGPGLFIAIAIVFQPELRKIFLHLGQREFLRPGTVQRIAHMDTVITAAELLSQQRKGALIVFPRKINIKNIIETGTRLNSELSSSLIVAIFQNDSPLHDGAMIVQNNRIAAAGCLLPLSDQQDIRKNFGTRHRASLGMSEQSDAIVLVVSEETGAISIAFDSKLYYDLSVTEVTHKLNELLEKGFQKKLTHSHSKFSQRRYVLHDNANDNEKEKN